MKKIASVLIICLFVYACINEDEPIKNEASVSTRVLTNITDVSAVGGGDVLDQGSSSVTIKGICWSTSPNPDVNDNITNDGSGSGVYSSSLTGLINNTTYYVRAYATNNVGTAYGEQQEFTTQISTTIPTVSTSPISFITDNTATGGGEVSNDGGSPVISKGVCWSLTPDPDINDNITNDGPGIGTYSSLLSGLNDNTTYYVKAYATNSAGTAYGTQEQFTTQLSATFPTVSTADIIEFTKTTATVGGEVTDDGGSSVTSKGVCWSTSQIPDISDNSTDNGMGTGNFSSELAGLTENTTYYVRAYATNSVGTAYGYQKQFTTIGTFTGETISVQGGTFEMGNNSGNPNEFPVHTVTVSSFAISKYEITNAQYATFLNDIDADSNGNYNGSDYININDLYHDCQIYHDGNMFIAESGKENYPVIMVSWHGARAFSIHYSGRLPTEAEWEFAARGGNSNSGYTYSGGDIVDDVAIYWDNSENPFNDLHQGHGSFEVGTKNPNELGIYDMSGNVLEMCNDYYESDYYSNSPSVDPQGPISGYERVVRSGSWIFSHLASRVSWRVGRSPHFQYHHHGFRPVFEP